MIIDASNQVLGRLSSTIAKKLLKGEEVQVINAERAIITGRPEIVVEDYEARVRRGGPHHGPYYPRNADAILKRSIRGMMPYKKPKGREAMKKLKIYAGNPLNKEGEKIVKSSDDITCKFITLDKLSKRLRGTG